MRFRDMLLETWDALKSNKARSLLTVLGIVIGISAVIAMTALIGGVKQSLLGELGLSQARAVYMNVYGGRSMTRQDLDELRHDMPDYEYVTGMTMGSAEASTGSKQKQANVYGIESSYFDATASRLVDGRFITEREVDGSALVVVLDTPGVKALFGSEDAQAVGKRIRIGSNEYAVVGVIEGTPNNYNASIMVYMPLTTCMTRVTGFSYIDQTIGYAREGVDATELGKKTEDWLAKHFRISDEDRESSMYVYSMQSVIDQMNAAMASFQLIMTSVAGISLIVGGIGIMNMMLTNVTERIREIGLRKALGARRRDITNHFLLESVCLCLTGGAIGTALGYLGALALAAVAGGFMGTTGSITPVIDVNSMLLVAGICVGIGIVFGYYPARRAAKLDPVESLHFQ